MSKLRQVTLENRDGCKDEGCKCVVSHQTVWVNDRPDLKLGVFITLKNSDEPERLWEVVTISEMSIHDYDINRGWNNNI